MSPAMRELGENCLACLGPFRKQDSEFALGYAQLGFGGIVEVVPSLLPVQVQAIFETFAPWWKNPRNTLAALKAAVTNGIPWPGNVLDWDRREVIAAALEKHSIEEIEEVVLQLAVAENAHLRIEAARIAAVMGARTLSGPNADWVRLRLAHLALDSDRNLRKAARVACKKIGIVMPAPIPEADEVPLDDSEVTLRRLLEDMDESIENDDEE
jgi:hypothetical protein